MTTRRLSAVFSSTRSSINLGRRDIETVDWRGQTWNPWPILRKQIVQKSTFLVSWFQTLSPVLDILSFFNYCILLRVLQSFCPKSIIIDINLIKKKYIYIHIFIYITKSIFLIRLHIYIIIMHRIIFFTFINT